MMRMTKITSNENYQRYHIAFSHAIGFTVAVDGTSLSKTVEFTENQWPSQGIFLMII